ncbi:MAG: DUF2269 family protein [Pirellulaceae bacterium]
MDYLNLAMRWLHIIPAIALVGGTIFMRFAVVPACEQLDDEQREKVQESVRRGWSRLLMPSILFLLISGFVNTANISMTYDFPGGYYMPLLAIKLVLAIAIFYIASLLAGRSEAASKFRQNQRTWLNINILLAVLLICIAGAMRLADREPKPAESEKTPSAAIETFDQARDGSLLRKC